MGASFFIWSYKPLYRPHFGAGCWGLLLDLAGKNVK